jgi:hypothetical protein
MFPAEIPRDLAFSTAGTPGLTPLQRMCTVPDHANAQSRNRSTARF